MGMYDYVKCEYPLPRPEMQERTFQTKSTPRQFLDTYIITADGKLQEPKYELVLVKDKDAYLGEKFEYKHFEMCEINFSGTIVFYDFEINDGYANSDLIYFEALFDHGTIVSIQEKVEKELEF